jgi:hypothetical protein
VEGEPLVDIEAIERRLIGYTSSQAGLVVQDCWHLASALRSARRERDEARERAADYERACKAREEAIDGLTSEAMALIKERNEARALVEAVATEARNTIDHYRAKAEGGMHVGCPVLPLSAAKHLLRLLGRQA